MEAFGSFLRNERKVSRQKIILICVRNEGVNGKSRVVVEGRRVVGRGGRSLNKELRCSLAHWESGGADFGHLLNVASFKIRQP